MAGIELKQLSTKDGLKVFEMLQRIGSCENEFKNTAHGLTYDEYKVWLVQQDDWSKGANLPEGYVAQTIYWLIDEDNPVGIGKIRHELNCQLKAREIGVLELLLSVEKYNPASKKVIEKNGGKLINENEDRWFFTFN